MKALYALTLNTKSMTKSMCAIFCVCNGSFKIFAIYLAFKYLFNNKVHEYRVQKFKLGVSFYQKMQMSNMVYMIIIYGNYIVDLLF